MSAATDAASSTLQQFKPLDSQTAITNANQQYDVGGSQTRLSALKGIVGNLQTSLDAVDPSVTGRTTGTFTTEGQRAALVNNERAPILTNLTKEQGATNAAASDLTQKQSLASQMASSLLNDNKSQYQRLLDTYNNSKAQDAAAEAKAEHDQQMAEQKREFDLQQQANARNAASKASSKAATQKASLNDLFDGYQPGKDNFYTEKVVIPTLISQGMSAKNASAQAYAYRKAVFGH